MNIRKLTAAFAALCTAVGITAVPVFAEGEDTGTETNTYVAKIGETQYTTLSSAISNASAGDTVTLLSDVTIGDNDYNDTYTDPKWANNQFKILSLTKGLTLDLGQNTLTIDNGGTIGVYININNEDKDEKVTLKNGTINDISGSSSSVPRSRTVYLNNGNLATENIEIKTQVPDGTTFSSSETRFSYGIVNASYYSGANVILGSGTKITEVERTYEGAPTVDHNSGYYGVAGVLVFGYYSAQGWNNVTDKANAERASLTVEDGVVINVSEYAIVTNGSYHPVDITVNGGTMKAEHSPGIFFPSDGTLTIKGGEITGVTGVELRAGTLNMTGGSVTSTGSPISSQANGSGTTVYGAALAVSQHTTNYDINVNISGGTLTGFIPLYEEDLQDESSENIYLNVTGGNFICQGEAEEGSQAVSQAVYSENCTDFITGGTFSTDVKEYVASGYAEKIGTDSYTVAKAGDAGAKGEGTYVSGVDDDGKYSQIEVVQKNFTEESGNTVTFKVTKNDNTEGAADATTTVSGTLPTTITSGNVLIGLIVTDIPKAASVKIEEVVVVE